MYRLLYSEEDDACARSFPKETLQEYACNFNNLRGIMKETGDNRYKPAHNNSRNRKKETGSPIDLRVNLEDIAESLRRALEYV